MKVKSMKKVTHEETYQISNQHFTQTNNPQIEILGKALSGHFRSWSFSVIFVSGAQISPIA